MVTLDIWRMLQWKKYLAPTTNRRTGLRLKFDSNIDPEVRRACKDFAKWLRGRYVFPLRIPVYIKGKKYIKTMDGDFVYGSFFEPFDFDVEPYIRIAAGDYSTVLLSIGKDNALAQILHCMAHELTHYFQWINRIELTDIGRERQATTYANRILSEYAQTRDHP